MQVLLQVATEDELGLFGAYIKGDFSFVDKTNGLLNLIVVKLMAYGYYSSSFSCAFTLKYASFADSYCKL